VERNSNITQFQDKKYSYRNNGGRNKSSKEKINFAFIDDIQIKYPLSDNGQDTQKDRKKKSDWIK